jgi:serine/threonine protein phosphatase PrpC
MIGCDGIFERLNNRDCVDEIWNRITEQINMSNKMGNGAGETKGKRDKSNPAKQVKPRTGSAYNEHLAAADGVEIIIRAAAASRSLDNITSLILGLKGLKKTI